MKLIRDKKYVDKYKRQKQKALEGCEVCPCCGEETWIDWRKHQFLSLTLNGFVQKEKRFYKCKKCSAMWKSGSYIIEDKYGDI